MLSLYTRLYQALVLLTLGFTLYSVFIGDYKEALGAAISCMLIGWFCLNPSLHRIKAFEEFSFKHTRFNPMFIGGIVALVAFILYF